jgi:SWI/SNF-related matrix-associated actin-dependent regulator of chromatin subfamily A member 5
MGLGKTLQTISLLAYLRESRGVKGPHLVIVPKSVVGNWIREFNKWCPPIKATKMGGTREERDEFIKNYLPRNPVNGKYPFDVLVTSYEGLLKEKGRLGKVEWKYLVVDEAHRLKNHCSLLSIAVRTMKVCLLIRN